jgi:hypothetical protein
MKTVIPCNREKVKNRFPYIIKKPVEGELYGFHLNKNTVYGWILDVSREFSDKESIFFITDKEMIQSNQIIDATNYFDIDVPKYGKHQVYYWDGAHLIEVKYRPYQEGMPARQFFYLADEPSDLIVVKQTS